MKKWEKNSPRAQTTLLASCGPVFIVLPSPASSSIDHVPILLPPVLVCWSRPLPAVVEGDEWGGRNHQLEHGSCDLLRVGFNDLKKDLKFKSFEPTLNKSHDYVFVTRAQGKQDPENHIRALPTVASATDAGYGTANRTPTFCGI